jgi:hypothetical protein|tara:strand:- start:441 stop:659 length:219 start_codon:yes stop_codon:yes gene_type:complete
MKSQNIDLPDELRSPTEDEFRQDLSEKLYIAIYKLEGALDGLQGVDNGARIKAPDAKEAYGQSRAEWNTTKS